MREVDDALREEQMLTAVRRYAKPVGAAVIAGLAALAGWLWYDSHRAGVADAQGEAFTQALDQVEAGKLDAGRDQLQALGRSAGPGYRAAARVAEAGIALQQNKPAAAIALFNQVAADETAPRAYRDLATLRAVAAQFDTLPPDQVAARLKPLAVPGNAWFGSAGEMLAIAYLKQGRGDLAGPLLGAIARDETAPQGVRARAAQLAGGLGVDTVDDVAKAMAPAPAPADAAQ